MDNMISVVIPVLNEEENVVPLFKEIKKVMFNIEGAQYFFSEQIISHLSKGYKRSEAIQFLDHAININLLIEAGQQDLLQLTRQKGS